MMKQFIKHTVNVNSTVDALQNSRLKEYFKHLSLEGGCFNQSSILAANDKHQGRGSLPVNHIAKNRATIMLSPLKGWRANPLHSHSKVTFSLLLLSNKRESAVIMHA